MASTDTGCDVFISHASEDKDGFVRALAVALRNLGVSVWYDEFSLSVGDSLSESIDKGLAGAQYGIVVISKAFMGKPWPKRELRGLVAKAVDAGNRKIILPIWHGVRREDVLAFSPPLADVVALNTQMLDAGQMSLRLLEEVRPDLYKSRPPEELRSIANGDDAEELRSAIDEIRTELEGVKDQLSEYQCPVCGANLAERAIVPIDDPHTLDCWFERYECGYESKDQIMTRPCPSDPKYPNPKDYELSCVEVSEGRWLCSAKPLTYMASLVLVWSGEGDTREEAEADVCRRLPQRQTSPPPEIGRIARLSEAACQTNAESQIAEGKANGNRRSSSRR